MPPDSPSVLIIRLDAVGDALALAPLLAAFRAAEIPVDLVLRENNAGVFSSRAARRTTVAPFELRSSEPDNLARIDEFGAQLRAAGYTHVLVPTEDPGGYRLAAATHAPVRIGFTNGWGKPLKSLWTRRFLTSSVYRAAGLDPSAPHECEVLFRLGAALAGTPVPPRDPGILRPLVLEREPAGVQPVTMQVTDKWHRLGIDTQDVVRLAQRVAALGGRFVSSAAETSYADDIERATGVHVERFDDLEPWKEAIAAARALVAPDSGAMHVAGMTGTPVVTVFPPSSDFALQVARWSPWAAPYRVLRAEGDWPALAGDALEQLAR